MPATCRSPRRSPSTASACCRRSRSYFEHHGLTADWDAIDRANDDALVTCLAMACPFEPNEKQALLECEAEGERLAMMQALFEMSAHAASGPRSRMQ